MLQLHFLFYRFFYLFFVSNKCFDDNFINKSKKKIRNKQQRFLHPTFFFVTISNKNCLQPFLYKTYIRVSVINYTHSEVIVMKAIINYTFTPLTKHLDRTLDIS